MTGQAARVRSMKARHQSSCPRCRRLIRIGNRITRLEDAWLCVSCAVAISATNPTSTSQTRTTP